MQPSAKVICDSVSPAGDRLITLECVMHRFVLAEFNTHRVFSRNSASSRAIPVQKQIDKVSITPALPISWGKNQKGMQAEQELTIEEQDMAREIWLSARDAMVYHAKRLMDLGVHKQITNRLLEPFMWHTVIVSFTEWPNFEVQRCSPLAQPEMAAVAFAMREARNKSTPQLIKEGKNGWHLPYIDSSTTVEVTKKYRYEINDCLDACRKISVARCARVSYETHDGKRDIQEDLNMFERLLAANPPHMSPFEHVATPFVNYGSSSEMGNFKGWTQFRHWVFGR